jgi:hypothetical protein
MALIQFTLSSRKRRALFSSWIFGGWSLGWLTSGTSEVRCVALRCAGKGGPMNMPPLLLLMAEPVGTYLRWPGLGWFWFWFWMRKFSSIPPPSTFSSAQLSLALSYLSFARSFVSTFVARSPTGFNCCALAPVYLLIPALNCPSNASTAAASRPSAAPPTTPAIHCSPGDQALRQRSRPGLCSPAVLRVLNVFLL